MSFLCWGCRRQRAGTPTESDQRCNECREAHIAAHLPPKGIAVRYCPHCAFLEYGAPPRINREDEISATPCNECAQPTIVCFYGYERTTVPR